MGCSECPAKHYALGGKCTKCSDDSSSVSSMILYIVVGLTIIYGLWHITRKPDPSKSPIMKKFKELLKQKIMEKVKEESEGKDGEGFDLDANMEMLSEYLDELLDSLDTLDKIRSTVQDTEKIKAFVQDFIARVAINSGKEGVDFLLPKLRVLIEPALRKYDLSWEDLDKGLDKLFPFPEDKPANGARLNAEALLNTLQNPGDLAALPKTFLSNLAKNAEEAVGKGEPTPEILDRILEKVKTPLEKILKRFNLTWDEIHTDKNKIFLIDFFKAAVGEKDVLDKLRQGGAGLASFGLSSDDVTAESGNEEPQAQEQEESLVPGEGGADVDADAGDSEPEPEPKPELEGAEDTQDAAKDGDKDKAAAKKVAKATASGKVPAKKVAQSANLKLSARVKGGKMSRRIRVRMTKDNETLSLADRLKGDEGGGGEPADDDHELMAFLAQEEKEEKDKRDARVSVRERIQQAQQVVEKSGIKATFPPDEHQGRLEKRRLEFMVSAGLEDASAQEEATKTKVIEEVCNIDNVFGQVDMNADQLAQAEDDLRMAMSNTAAYLGIGTYHLQISGINIGMPIIKFSPFLKIFGSWMSVVIGFEVGSVAPPECLDPPSAMPSSWITNVQASSAGAYQKSGLSTYITVHSLFMKLAYTNLALVLALTLFMSVVWFGKLSTFVEKRCCTKCDCYNDKKLEQNQAKEDKHKKETKERVREIFNQVDVDNGGSLDKDEIGALAKIMAGTELSVKRLDEILDEMDEVDESGKKSGDVDFDEFYVWWEKETEKAETDNSDFAKFFKDEKARLKQGDSTWGDTVRIHGTNAQWALTVLAVTTLTKTHIVGIDCTNGKFDLVPAIDGCKPAGLSIDNLNKYWFKSEYENYAFSFYSGCGVFLYCFCVPLYLWNTLRNGQMSKSQSITQPLCCDCSSDPEEAATKEAKQAEKWADKQAKKAKEAAAAEAAAAVAAEVAAEAAKKAAAAAAATKVFRDVYPERDVNAEAFPLHFPVESPDGAHNVDNAQLGLLVSGELYTQQGADPVGFRSEQAADDPGRLQGKPIDTSLAKGEVAWEVLEADVIKNDIQFKVPMDRPVGWQPLMAGAEDQEKLTKARAEVPDWNTPAAAKTRAEGRMAGAYNPEFVVERLAVVDDAALSWKDRLAQDTAAGKLKRTTTAENELGLAGRMQGGGAEGDVMQKPPGCCAKLFCGCWLVGWHDGCCSETHIKSIKLAACFCWVLCFWKPKGAAEYKEWKKTGEGVAAKETKTQEHWAAKAKAKKDADTRAHDTALTDEQRAEAMKRLDEPPKPPGLYTKLFCGCFAVGHYDGWASPTHKLSVCLSMCMWWPGVLYTICCWSSDGAKAWEAWQERQWNAEGVRLNRAIALSEDDATKEALGKELAELEKEKGSLRHPCWRCFKAVCIPPPADKHLPRGKLPVRIIMAVICAPVAHWLSLPTQKLSLSFISCLFMYTLFGIFSSAGAESAAIFWYFVTLAYTIRVCMQAGKEKKPGDWMEFQESHAFVLHKYLLRTTLVYNLYYIIIELYTTNVVRSRYKPEQWWFEVFVTSDKVMRVVFAAMLSGHPKVFLGANVFLSLIFVNLVARYQPYAQAGGATSQAPTSIVKVTSADIADRDQGKMLTVCVVNGTDQPVMAAVKIPPRVKEGDRIAVKLEDDAKGKTTVPQPNAQPKGGEKEGLLSGTEGSAEPEPEPEFDAVKPEPESVATRQSLTHDISMASDGTLSLEAVIRVPVATKRKGGRVGNIIGSSGNPSRQPALNFELHNKGQVRLHWNGGEVDIFGTTDLRDGKEHTVAFTRTRQKTEIIVDGVVENTGKAGAEMAVLRDGIFVCCDWRDGGMGFRGEIMSVKAQGAKPFSWEPAAPLLLQDFVMASDGSLSVEAVVRVPTATKAAGGRVGVLLGNENNPSKKKSVNFELHDKGQVRLWWNSGEIDLFGTTDLRDGREHRVAFARTRSQTQLIVDGVVEKSGPGGQDVGACTDGSFVGCDWREGGLGFRGDILSLQINGANYRHRSSASASDSNLNTSDKADTTEPLKMALSRDDKLAWDQKTPVWIIDTTEAEVAVQKKWAGATDEEVTKEEVRLTSELAADKLSKEDKARLEAELVALQTPGHVEVLDNKLELITKVDLKLLAKDAGSRITMPSPEPLGASKKAATWIMQLTHADIKRRRVSVHVHVGLPVVGDNKKKAPIPQRIASEMLNRCGGNAQQIVLPQGAKVGQRIAVSEPAPPGELNKIQLIQQISLLMEYGSAAALIFTTEQGEDPNTTVQILATIIMLVAMVAPFVNMWATSGRDPLVLCKFMGGSCTKSIRVEKLQLEGDKLAQSRYEAFKHEHAVDEADLKSKLADKVEVEVNGEWMKLSKAEDDWKNKNLTAKADSATAEEDILNAATEKELEEIRETQEELAGTVSKDAELAAILKDKDTITKERTLKKAIASAKGEVKAQKETELATLQGAGSAHNAHKDRIDKTLAAILKDKVEIAKETKLKEEIASAKEGDDKAKLKKDLAILQLAELAEIRKKLRELADNESKAAELAAIEKDKESIEEQKKLKKKIASAEEGDDHKAKMEEELTALKGASAHKAFKARARVQAKKEKLAAKRAEDKKKKDAKAAKKAAKNANKSPKTVLKAELKAKKELKKNDPRTVFEKRLLELITEKVEKELNEDPPIKLRIRYDQVADKKVTVEVRPKMSCGATIGPRGWKWFSDLEKTFMTKMIEEEDHEGHEYVGKFLIAECVKEAEKSVVLFEPAAKAEPAAKSEPGGPKANMGLVPGEASDVVDEMPAEDRLAMLEARMAELQMELLLEESDDTDDEEMQPEDLSDRQATLEARAAELEKELNLSGSDEE